MATCEPPAADPSKGAIVIVNRLDPDGHLRDLIDVALYYVADDLIIRD